MKTAVYSSISSWRSIVFAWLALALFDATQTVVTMRAMGMHHSWLTLFLVTTASWSVWVLATPAVLALLQRFCLPTKEVMYWVVHAAACTTISAVWATWSALLEHATNPLAIVAGPGAFTDILQAKFLGNLVGNVILYGAVVALNHILDTHKRLAQQQAARVC